MLTLKMHAVRLGIPALLLVLPSMLSGQQPVTSSEATPEGWHAYPNSALENPNETTVLCFNHSSNEWEVTTESGDLKIKRWSSRKASKSSFPQSLKNLHHQEGMPGRTVNAGFVSATHYEDSWLLAYDGGEWGGGLWLTNEDGSSTKRIVNENVRAVIPIDSGILVLSGLAHMTMDSGNAFIFSVPQELNISLQHSIPLDGAPSTYMKASDGSVLFVTSYGLCRITKSGELQRLVDFPKWTPLLYPNSMVVDRHGAIFIGMRMFVLRLRQISNGYSKVWLLPSRECQP